MAGSSFGKVFQITTWGESHGSGLGVVIDGCPAGVYLQSSDFQHDMDRRRPGQNQFVTQRQELDSIQILSGIFENVTTGMPIAIFIPNQDQHSKDYEALANCYRPGHADFTFEQKYGLRDYRGGGRSSGRETAARVAAGVVAKKILDTLHIRIQGCTSKIGPVSVEPTQIRWEEVYQNPLYLPDEAAYQQAAAVLERCKEQKDSIGGEIFCEIDGLPIGLGEPVFDKLQANLAKAICSIGAVKGITFGDGFAVSDSFGSQNNDAFQMDQDKVVTKTNHAGGTLGGISNGAKVMFHVAVKPTPSIGKKQFTVSTAGEMQELEIKGRHDPCIVPRAVVVVEAMAAVAVVDLLYQNMFSRIDNIKRLYQV